MKKKILRDGIRDAAVIMEEEARRLRALVETENIEVEFSLEELGTIALAAHKLDMTLNQYFNYAMERLIHEHGLTQD